MLTLLIVAILPVIVLCWFIYAKDTHKEPGKLLRKIFFLGFFSFIPILICEIILTLFFDPEKVDSFVLIFLFTFLSVAIVEEGWKWLVVKLNGYNNKEFDEVYDIIVYSVFASLGFACIENILYVVRNGLGTGFLRALLSVPGHTCFGVIMGYFFSRAKVASINNQQSVYKKNLALSILMPSLFHTMYDSLIFYYSVSLEGSIYSLFIIYHIVSVILCIWIVLRVSKVQEVLNKSVEKGIISNDGDGHIVFHNNEKLDIHFCPVCGSPVGDGNFCGKCGCKIR